MSEIKTTNSYKKDLENFNAFIQISLPKIENEIFLDLTKNNFSSDLCKKSWKRVKKELKQKLLMKI